MKYTKVGGFKSFAEILDADPAVSAKGKDWVRRAVEISDDAAALQSAWLVAAGPLAAHSRLSHLNQSTVDRPTNEKDTDNHRDGRIARDQQIATDRQIAVVFADSAAWASRIRMSALSLCDALNGALRTSGEQKFHAGPISAIRVHVAPRRAPSD